MEKLKSLLNPGGQVFLDSSDLIYLFEESPNGEKFIPGSQYYGELEYSINYKDKTRTFPWLYLGFGLLNQAAHKAGLKTNLILEGENWDYLARLTI